MKNPSPIAIYVLVAWLVWALPQPATAEDFAFYHENVLGTSFELQVRAASAEAARGVEDRVLREIDRLQAILSGYDPGSEFRRWNDASAGPVKVSPELFEILKASDHWRLATDGAFDPRVEALTKLWSTSAKKGRTPTDQERARVKAQMSRPAWRLDREQGAAERLTDCPLSFNSIGKGFIIEKACDAALGEGPSETVRGLLLNIGGDIRVCGEIDRPVGIASPWNDSETTEPIVHVAVKNQAVATSGRAQRGWRVNGRWYSHIFDPRTGLPADATASATVIADRSADANALATTLNVLAPEEGLRLVRSIPGVDCLIATADGRVFKSAGWARYERSAAPVIAFANAQEPESSSKPKAAKNSAWWAEEYELKIDFEIGRPEDDARRYRRPYVAVWIEDENEKPVRTLELWLSMAGPGFERWLPDLKRWSDFDDIRRRAEKTDLAHTISRPTRQPGKYSVVWNGRDNKGKRLPAGEYTVNIEAAREHGTYQIIRKKVTIPAKPFAEDLKGNVEIKSAAVEYRRKPPATSK